MNSNPIPLTLVAAEIGMTADHLGERLGTAVITNDIGLRCISSDVARDVIAGHRAALQAQRDKAAAERDRARHRPNPVRDYIRQLRATQKSMDTPSGPMAPGEALELLKLADGTREAKLHASAERFDELTTGRMTYHKISERG